ncbi:type IV secretory system conjugative DNA transfer family protein [Mycoplasma cottewii]|uniref:Type IV secretory system conjugative DNA transfer family protein n=1 Tax=Mycoplasma cottewii TaxID=51364 RepID=A0ABY5TXN8_9MOLU|nr:type IV secretory system conjugative DNA transfer family protein [Mycoplasma cottewii]UWD34771.1 type IV secretory system conjugative DNA transfer family protein [Mycoplasma cottewii]
MKKNKNELRDKLSTKLMINIFCFVLWPLTSFLLLTIIMIVVKEKNFSIIAGWLTYKRNIAADFSNFWTTNSSYRNWSIVIIVGGIFVFLIHFNYEKWWELIKKKIFKNKDLTQNNWEYNQFTKDGDLQAFKKKFKPGKPNFSLGMFNTKTKKQYLVNNTDSHAIVLGISGSMKTEKIVLPNIWYNATLPDDKKPNMVITDPKKQILARTGKMFLENGYKIKVFDFDDSLKSLYWNPLEQIWKTLHSKPKEQLDEFDYGKAYDKIIELVDMLPWTNEENSMWEQNAKNILILLLKFFLLYSLEEETFTLQHYTIANLIPTLSTDFIKNGSWIQTAKNYQNNNQYWFDLCSEQKPFIDIVPETLSGILTNATKAINAFSQNLTIKKITSNITFSIKELVRDESSPYVIFICFPDHKNIYSFLMNMLITQIYQEAVDYANTLPKQKLNRMLQFYLEEFNSLLLPQIPDWMAISRSRNIFFMLIIQSYEQLQKYSTKGRDFKAIKAQARLNFLLETNSEETLKSFSQSLGEKIIEKKSINESDNHTSTTTSEQKELIMSVSDLKYKNPDMTIITSGGSKPIAIKLTPAFDYLPIDEYIHPTTNKTNVVVEKVWDFSTMKEAKLDNVEVQKQKQIQQKQQRDRELRKSMNQAKKAGSLHFKKQ